MHRAYTLVAAGTLAALIAFGLLVPLGPREIRALPDRETHLPGNTLVLYPTRAAARAACGAEPVAVDDAFACGDDLAANVRGRP